MHVLFERYPYNIAGSPINFFFHHICSALNEFSAKLKNFHRSEFLSDFFEKKYRLSDFSRATKLILFQYKKESIKDAEKFGVFTR